MHRASQDPMALWHKILSSPSSRYLIMTHFPGYDLDGITSALAIGTMIKLLGIENVTFYVPLAKKFHKLLQELPEVANVLSNVNCYFDNDFDLDNFSNLLCYYDTLIVVDRPSPSRLMSSDHPMYEGFADLMNRMFNADNTIVLDHRDASAIPNYIKEFGVYYSDDTAPSTTTVIFRLIKALLSHIDESEITADIREILKDVYMLIYIGMINDSMLTTTCTWSPESTAMLAEIEPKIADKYDLQSIKFRAFCAKPHDYYDLIRKVSNRVIEIEPGLFVAFISFYDLYVSSHYTETFEEALFYINYDLARTYLYKQNANLFALVSEFPGTVRLVYTSKCDCDLSPIHERLGASGRKFYGYATYQDNVDTLMERLQRAYAEVFLVPQTLKDASA